jgi:hypothetical protein
VPFRFTKDDAGHLAPVEWVAVAMCGRGRASRPHSGWPRGGSRPELAERAISAAGIGPPAAPRRAAYPVPAPGPYRSRCTGPSSRSVPAAAASSPRRPIAPEPPSRSPAGTRPRPRPPTHRRWRGRVEHLDGDPRVASVQAGRQKQQPGDRGAAQPVGLTARRLGQPLEEIIGPTLHVELSIDMAGRTRWARQQCSRSSGRATASSRVFP